MHGTIEDNLAEIRAALATAKAAGASMCGLSELALTGFHRGVVELAHPTLVQPALAAVQALCAELQIAAALGAPSFGDDGRRHIAHHLIDAQGRVAATVLKQGLTDPEATFFSRGSQRPVAMLGSLRCSAVICREIEEFESIVAALPAGTVDLIFVPGALRQDPDKPVSDPPPYVNDIRSLALATGAWMVQTNWPNALNRPEESADAGQSAVISPQGRLLFRLPRQCAGVGVFGLGDAEFEWFPS